MKRRASPRRPARALAALAVAASLAVGAAHGAQGGELSGELRLRLDPRDGNPKSAGTLAQPLVDAAPASLPSEVGIEVLLRLRLDLRVADVPVTGFADVQVAGLGDRDGETRASGRVNELYLSAPVGGLQLSAGRRVVQWDVGTVFRPNDLVQQEQTNLLLPTKPQGRALLQVERFTADATASLVWVNPQHSGADADAQRGGAESALAAMAYARHGATDLYGFARIGHHTGLSLGAAAVAVLSDAVSVHASLRGLQRHDGWVNDIGDGGAAADVVTANPWRLATLGRAAQGLVGATWTGESRQTVTVEYWYDGTSLTDAQWTPWLARSDALATQLRAALAGQGGQAGGVPTAALAGNLAWQDAPLQLPNRRRETFFVRLAWQPEPWLLSLDTLYNPVDAGHITTAGLQWQGDGMRVNAALRWFGGPASALARRLPLRHSGLVAVTWAY